MKPLVCPISWRMAVNRSYLPEAGLLGAAVKYESVPWNSLLSCGVGSMNQPTPLASVSMLMVAALGRPLVSYPVMVASASCPVGRFVMSKLRLMDVLVCQMDWAVE